MYYPICEKGISYLHPVFNFKLELETFIMGFVLNQHESEHQVTLKQ